MAVFNKQIIHKILLIGCRKAQTSSVFKDLNFICNIVFFITIPLYWPLITTFVQYKRVGGSFDTSSSFHSTGFFHVHTKLQYNRYEEECDFHIYSCLSMRKIYQKVMDRFRQNFVDRLGVNQGRIDIILLTI